MRFPPAAVLPVLLFLTACEEMPAPVEPCGEASPASTPCEGEKGEEELPVSRQTRRCLGCHETVSPGIVADWRASLHARTTPQQALEKPEAGRRMSAKTVPEKLQNVVVGCYECHSQNPDAHKDNFKHLGFSINVIVTPADCRTCHPVEADEYAGSKKAHAVDNLDRNPVFTSLVECTIGLEVEKDGVVERKPPSEATKAATCYGCHGTTVRVRGMKTVQTALDEIEVPDLEGWPNQGVGRVNPDGSRGACTSCHPRHGFSIEVARKPHTCAQCHLEPDTPAWEVYQESKHGNLYLSEGDRWNWTAVPWKAGADFRAPTCATCHASQVADPNGETIIPRTHDYGSRLWVRLFGLPFSHPQPKSGATWSIRNADGQPLPTTLAGEPAAGFLIDRDEQARRRGAMSKLCLACHSTSWTDGHFDRMDKVIADADGMTLAATRLLQRAWKEGLADPAVLFDEPVEKRWVKQWLFYATSVKYSAAMGGSDYATFKNGWWELSENLGEMREWVEKSTKKK